ncbi:LA2681 family HEPN domain-containing protein [Pseudomonas sp. A014]|uniref:LA2681 family HEPN domain-containing protein n=1 Tax=Pseudomonas sp. A014 TaxID=3458058 RepID=UPI00403745CF
MKFNLATAIISAVGFVGDDAHWIDHLESTKALRAEARGYFWQVAQNTEADESIRTQSWANLANQLEGSFRLSEAHDARLAALHLDPGNGVAAACAIRYLVSCYRQGLCSDLAMFEASALANIVESNRDRIIDYAGLQAADSIAAWIRSLPEAPARQVHSKPFVSWVERERLTLAPSVALIDPDQEKIDWLVLPGIWEQEPNSALAPAPIFSMFNQLKSDFILARDLAWRSMDDSNWPTTGRFADTSDSAVYGPASSALSLAHRASLDLLDKIAVTANSYFNLGHNFRSVTFGKLWRSTSKDGRPLADQTKRLIQKGVHSLYGLAELADDYDALSGRLRPLKELRNAGTHRFLVLHGLGDPAKARQLDEIERYSYDEFRGEALRALRVARSAIQMLVDAIGQYEKLRSSDGDGLVVTLDVPDRD